jgi:hypothetical protein
LFPTQITDLRCPEPMTECKQHHEAVTIALPILHAGRSGAVGQTWRWMKPTSRPNVSCHKRKLLDVTAITFWR